MVNERYQQDVDHEEGEYHFSDDQANYDMEPGGSVKGSAAVQAQPKESIADKLKQHRRIVIGIFVFIVLLGIVYKLVAPSPSPTTDFQPGQATSATESVKIPPKKAVAPSTPLATQPTATAQPITTTTTTTQSTAMPQTVQSASPQPILPPSTAAPVSEQPPAAPTASVTTTTTDGTMQREKTILDRVATLEQQNAALVNLMQTQYAQKISDTELQNTQLRTQVQELTSRISNMEVAFRQLTKMLQHTATAPTVSVSNRVPTTARVVQPKNLYTVQAIIPGRAWLKSESGDTVTVAEGDMLKGYGRIIKIDPYDGIVDIDVGSKILSLSYGTNGD